ncbi:MAG: hypothetical protein K2N06_05520 [Oscillospiraceae bacterium]|nr:hypothetical protein [Oscillospiraceae bacterium]
MYTMPDDYIQLATAKTRKLSIRMTTITIDVSPDAEGSAIKKNEYYDGDGIISLKIVQGQTNGGFTIGNTVCATLTATLTNDIKVITPGESKDSSIWLYVRFLDGEAPTEWHMLGWFHVNAIKRGLHNQVITGYDVMSSHDKNWTHLYDFPAKISDILRRIIPNERLSLINDVSIKTEPVYNFTDEGEKIPYTEREMLGFIASLNGGNICVDGYTDDYRITVPQKTYYTIPPDGVISQTSDGTKYTIKSVVWEVPRTQASLDPDYEPGTVAFSNPLDVENSATVLTNISRVLKEITYDAITIKKQGTGFFQLGDIVDYQAYDGTVYTMLIQGIVYEISGGGFTETLYSPAKSDYAQSYEGRRSAANNGEAIPDRIVNSRYTEIIAGDFMRDGSFAVDEAAGINFYSRLSSPSIPYRPSAIKEKLPYASIGISDLNGDSGAKFEIIHFTEYGLDTNGDLIKYWNRLEFDREHLWYDVYSPYDSKRTDLLGSVQKEYVDAQDEAYFEQSKEYSADAISEHNTDESAHSYIQGKIRSVQNSIHAVEDRVSELESGGTSNPGGGYYTTKIAFKEGGFDLTFADKNGEETVNLFTVTEKNGRITKITNTTAGKEIEVTYE